MQGVVPESPRVRSEAGRREEPLLSRPPADSRPPANREISPLRSQLRSYQSASLTSGQRNVSISQGRLEIPPSGVSRPPTSPKKKKLKKKKHSRRSRHHGSCSAGSGGELHIDSNGYPVIARRTDSLISYSPSSHRAESANSSDTETETNGTDNSLRSLRSVEKRTKSARGGGDTSWSDMYIYGMNYNETPRLRGSWSTEKAPNDFHNETPRQRGSWRAGDAPKRYRADRAYRFERSLSIVASGSDTEDTDNSLRRNLLRSSRSSYRRNSQDQESFTSGSTSQVQNRSAARREDHKRRYLEEVKRNSPIAVEDRPLTDLEFALEMDKAAEESKRIDKQQQTSVVRKQVDYVQLRKLVGAYVNDPQQADHESLNKLLKAIGDDKTEPTTSMASSMSSSFRSLSTYQSIRSGTSGSRKEVDYTDMSIGDSGRRESQRGHLPLPAIIMDEKEVYKVLDLESSQAFSQSKYDSKEGSMEGLKREILDACGHEGFVSVPLRSAMPRKGAPPIPGEPHRRSGPAAPTYPESKTSPYQGRKPTIKNQGSSHQAPSIAAYRLLRSFQEESMETGEASPPESIHALSKSKDDSKDLMKGSKSEILEACHEGSATVPLRSVIPRRGDPSASVESQRESPYQGRRPVSNIEGSPRQTSSAAAHRLLRAMQEGSMETYDVLPPNNNQSISCARIGRNVLYTDESIGDHGRLLSERGHLSLPIISPNEVDYTGTSSGDPGIRESDRGHLSSPAIMVNEKEVYKAIDLAIGSQTLYQSKRNSKKDGMEGHKREILEACGHEEFVDVPLSSPMPRRSARALIELSTSPYQGRKPVINNQGGSRQTSSIVAHRLLRAMQEESICDNDGLCPDKKALDTGDPGGQHQSEKDDSTLVSTMIAVNEKDVNKALDQAKDGTVTSKSKDDSKMERLKMEVLHICGEEIGVKEFVTVPLKSAMPRAPTSSQLVVEDAKLDQQITSQPEPTPASRSVSKPDKGESVQDHSKSPQLPNKSDHPRKRFLLFNLLGKKNCKGRKDKSNN